MIKTVKILRVMILLFLVVFYLGAQRGYCGESSDTTMTEIGYGAISSNRVSGSVTTLTSDDFIPNSSLSILSLLEGRVAGLNITSSLGSDPNSQVSAQLRGVNSLNASSSPLIVVDGVAGVDISYIQREDILSITVLKDAASAAIYGMRGSGGVILITTNKARSGALITKYSTQLSTEIVHKRDGVLTASEYVELGQGTDYGYSTNWFDEITQNPFNQTHNISMSGGDERVSIYTSLTYKDYEGVAIGSTREEMSARANINYRFIPNILTLDGTIALARSKSSECDMDIFNQALMLNPTISPYDESDVTGYNLILNDYDFYNPVAEEMLQTDETENRYTFVSLAANLNIIDDKLTANARATIENDAYSYKYWMSTDHRISRESGVLGKATLADMEYSQLSWDIDVNYKNSWGKHSLDLIGGYSFYETNGEGFSATNQDFTVSGLTWNDLNSGSYLEAGRADVDSWKDPRYRLVAFFGRANYSYDDKYSATFSLRKEGSSMFSTGNNWGLFPSLSAMWSVHNESIISLPYQISSLNVRASYGVTGNQNFSTYSSTRLYNTSSWWLKDGVWSETIGLSNNYNEDLTWESNKEFNFGVDFTLFNSRVYGKLDFYTRHNTDLIYDVEVTNPLAMSSTMTINSGKIVNKGFEIELGGVVAQSSDFRYTTSLLLSKNKSTVKYIYDQTTYIDLKEFPTPGTPGNGVRLSAGSTIGDFYLWEHAGVSEDGSFLVYNSQGEAIDADDKQVEDKQYIGNGVPNVIISWNNRLNYKKFDFTALFTAWCGYDIFNMSAMYHGLATRQEENVLGVAYTQNSEITGEKGLSDYWLEDGTFLRLDAVTIGYNIDLAKFNNYVKSARIYFTASDIFTLTKYSGFDPAINISGLTPGFEESTTYPTSSTLMVGIELTF